MFPTRKESRVVVGVEEGRTGLARHRGWVREYWWSQGPPRSRTGWTAMEPARMIAQFFLALRSLTTWESLSLPSVPVLEIPDFIWGEK